MDKSEYTLLNCLWRKKLRFDDCITEENMSKFVDEINSIIKEDEFFGIKNNFFTYIMNRIFSCEDYNFVKFFLSNNNNFFGCYLYNESKALYVVSLYFKLGFNEIMEGINVLCDIGRGSKLVKNTVKGKYMCNIISTECIINLCNNKNIDEEEKRNIILELFNSPLGAVRIDIEIFDMINEYFTYDELKELVKNTNNLFYIHYDKFGKIGTNALLVSGGAANMWKIDDYVTNSLTTHLDFENVNYFLKDSSYCEDVKSDEVIEYLNKCEEPEKYMRKVKILDDEF